MNAMLKLGKLTFVRNAPKREPGRRVCLFLCDCGEYCERRIDLVRSSVARGGVPECNLCLVRNGRRTTAKGCRKCEELPWRRPRRGLCRCGERYEAEPVAPIWVLAQHRRTA